MSLMGFPASPANGDVYQLWTYDSASSHWHVEPVTSGESSLWDQVGSDIHYSDGKVGVKTTSFTHDLTVDGNASFSGGAVADLTGDVTGDIKSTDGAKVLENGANLAGAQFYGKVDGGSF